MASCCLYELQRRLTSAELPSQTCGLLCSSPQLRNQVSRQTIFFDIYAVHTDRAIEELCVTCLCFEDWRVHCCVFGVATARGRSR